MIAIFWEFNLKVNISDKDITLKLKYVVRYASQAIFQFTTSRHLRYTEQPSDEEFFPN